MSFLEATKKSFITSLETGPRSNEKLKVLHGFIAEDLQNRLGKEYIVKSLGFKDGKEEKITGRYMDKNVDITVIKNKKKIAGVAVKFVMSNYSQNSNNYFENMLGETANIRSHNTPYFQIFILPEKLPYYKQDRTISKWETITSNNVDKYIKISEDNVDAFYHTPNKTLFCLLKIGDFAKKTPKTADEYKQYFFNNDFEIKYSSTQLNFKSQTIYNDYELFMQKIYHAIKAI